jgi:hypothetical protein
MNCAEFQEILPEAFEGGRTADQESHLKSCPVCSSLVDELDLIANEARQLQEIAEPNQRVWASIEIALRQEGIIHEHERQSGPTLLPPVPRRWSMRWLAPVAAAAVIVAGVVVYQRGSVQPTPATSTIAQVAPSDQISGKKPVVQDDGEDQKLLEALASRSPATQKQYASNLQNVNAYIRDAEESAQADPNDEEAQQIVMDAYEQRAAVYEMALDRSMP